MRGSVFEPIGAPLLQPQRRARVADPGAPKACPSGVPPEECFQFKPVEDAEGHFLRSVGPIVVGLSIVALVYRSVASGK